MSTKGYSSKGIPLLPETLLKRMAWRRFKDDWNTEVDPKFFKAVARGEMLDVTEEKKGFPEKWLKRHRLKADRIAWLCHDNDAKALVPSSGIQIKGFWIEGDLKCEHIRVDFPLWMEQCLFTENIILSFAMLHNLSLNSSVCKVINAEGINVDDSVFLNNGFVSTGPVIFIGATIGGNFSCVDGQFSYEGVAICANGIIVKSNVLLRNVEAVGQVDFSAAEIFGQMDCSGSQFLFEGKSEDGEALPAFSAIGIKIASILRLGDNFVSMGPVDCTGAEVGGQFICDDGKFCYSGDDCPALNLNGCTFGQGVFLRKNFESNGQVNLIGVEIEGQLSCIGGYFKYVGKLGPSIYANGIKLSTSIYFRDGFKSLGSVDICEAEIGGQLDCSGGMFLNSEDTKATLVANGLKVVGNVLLRNSGKKHKLILKGKIDFTAAKIGGVFQFRDFSRDASMCLILHQAKVGILWDALECWPEPGKLKLHGFEYDSIDKHSPRDAESRLKWIELQNNDEFDPQPYEQLESVLRKMGHMEDAIDIGVEKEEKRLEFLNEDFQDEPPKVWWKRLLKKWGLRWQWIYGKVAFFGYRPFRYTLPLLIVIWLVGFIVFEIAFRYDIMRPTHKHADVGMVYPGIEGVDTDNLSGEEKALAELQMYPSFQGLMYSADVLIPLVQFHQTDFWQPNVHGGLTTESGGKFGKWGYRWQFSWGGLVMFWMYGQIVAGWALTTFIVYGLAGLVRKKE